MGNYNNGTVKFRQSINDFPLDVTLGAKSPDWMLSRWHDNKPLRFLPFCDEGFSLRGDKKRLVYKGRRKSHRFTILNDGAFEYDCILEKEPQTNVITLFMEGAHYYDFFRQPDFVREPFLKGSYAVYKKETLLGEGTGKLCHIHRPLIIDAKGSKCWGDILIEGNLLHIVIPERWLADAKYPVVVDPTIGTTAIGSQSYGVDPSGGDYDKPWLDNQFGLNKFLVPQNGNGSCTAYVYTYDGDSGNWVTPLLYTNYNNMPYMRKSKNEKDIYVDAYSNAAGWRNNTFEIDGNITAGDYVWFGVHSSWFTTRFDYGGECYLGWFDDDEITQYINIPKWDVYCTIKWSWYFNYTAVVKQDYVRTITQGVNILDNRLISAKYIREKKDVITSNDDREHTARYERVTEDVIKAEIEVKGIRNIFTKIFETVHSFENNFVNLVFKVMLAEYAVIKDATEAAMGYCSALFSTLEPQDKLAYGSVLQHKIADFVHTTAVAARGVLFFVRIFSALFFQDVLSGFNKEPRCEIVLKSFICKEMILESKISKR